MRFVQQKFRYVFRDAYLDNCSAETGVENIPGYLFSKSFYSFSESILGILLIHINPKHLMLFLDTFKDILHFLRIKKTYMLCSSKVLH